MQLISLGFFLSNIILILVMDIFPFQDLPQHLTYAHLFANKNIYSNIFEFPTHFEPYHSVYYLLAGLQNIFGLVNSFKMLLITYFLLGTLSFAHLYNTVHESNQGLIWAGILSTHFLWSGALYMGFISYAFGLPFFLWGISLLYNEKKSNWFRFSVCLGILCLMHILNSFILFFVSLILLIFQKRKKDIGIMCTLYVLMVGVTQSNASYLSGGMKIDWSTLFQSSWGFSFIDKIFDITWSSQTVLINYFVWNFSGPYCLVWSVILFPILALFYYKTGELKKETVLYKILLLLLLTFIFIPWGIKKPSEITFINFRILSYFIPLFWVVKKFRPNHYIVYFALIVSISRFSAFYSFRKEQNIFFNLLNYTKPNKKMMSVVFHNEIHPFAKMFRVSHFFPMYYTVFYNGLNAQFWGRYTKHLPVSFKKNHEINGTADWHPWKFKANDMIGNDYLIIQKSKIYNKISVKKVLDYAERNLIKLKCYNHWCLYKKNRRPINNLSFKK